MNRRFSGLWQHPDFMKLWVGQTVSEFGSRITRGGIPLIAVITLSASPADMGILAAVASLPVLVFGLFAGVWVDRLRRRPIMIAMDVTRLLLLLLIPAAALTGHLNMALLIGMTMVLGVLGLVFETAYRAYLPSLVEREHVVEGNSKLATTDSLAEIGGPAIAGFLIQVISAPLAILVDALTFAVSATSFALIRQPERKPERKPEPSAQAVAQGRSVRREIAEGISVILHDPVLRTLAIALALRSFFGNFYAALYDIYAVRELGMSAGLLGVSIAGGGIGALIGALLASRVQRRFGLGRTLIGALLISALISFLIPLAQGSPEVATLLLFAAQVVGDGAMMVYMIYSLSLQQIVVPDHLLGRTNASMGFLAQGVAPVGALIAGGLGALIGARGTLLIAVIGGLATAIWVSRSPLRQVADTPVMETPVETI